MLRTACRSTPPGHPGDSAAPPRRWGFDYNEMIRGLWIGNSAVTKDFLTVMYRIKALGFNAVRMPMSFKARPVGGRQSPPPAGAAATGWQQARRARCCQSDVGCSVP